MDNLEKKAQTSHHHHSKAQHTHSHTGRNAEIFITFSHHSCSHYKLGTWGIWKETEKEGNRVCIILSVQWESHTHKK